MKIKDRVLRKLVNLLEKYELTRNRFYWLLLHGYKYNPIYDYTRVEGWCLVDEAKRLFDLSVDICSNEPTIVEIGSWMGQSSIILAKAIRKKGQGKVYCVDPFLSGLATFTPEMKESASGLKDQSGSIFPAFEKNIRAAKVYKQIVPLKGFSHEIVKKWDRPIDFLFIDGDHSYEAVKRDFVEWSRFIRPGGWVAFHDVELPSNKAQYYAGPGRVVEELVLNNPEFVAYGITGYLYLAQRSINCKQADEK